MKLDTLNEDGQWMPRIPYPLVWFRKICTRCGRKYWTMEGYRGHYALRHIVKLP